MNESSWPCRADCTYLILIDIGFFEFFLSLILKGDDNQSDEDVHEEKGKDDEIDDIENSHF